MKLFRNAAIVCAILCSPLFGSALACGPTEYDFSEEAGRMGDLIEWDELQPHIRLTVGRDQLVVPVDLAAKWAKAKAPLPEAGVVRAIIRAWLEELGIEVTK